MSITECQASFFFLVLQANLPKYTSPVVTKYFKQLTGPYNEMVTAFYSKKPEELQVIFFFSFLFLFLFFFFFFFLQLSFLLHDRN